MDLGQPGNEKSDVTGVARKEGKTEVLSLLERFREHPEGDQARDQKGTRDHR